MPLQHHQWRLVSDGGTMVVATGVAATVTQVVDGIKHVSLAHAIVTNEAIHLWREPQLRLDNVLVVQY